MKLRGEVCSYLVIIGMEGWVSMDEEAHQKTISTPAFAVASTMVPLL